MVIETKNLTKKYPNGLVAVKEINLQVKQGEIFGSILESPEGFGLINSMVTFPLFFLSGALFPLSNLPSWLTVFTRIDPVAYGVDAIRYLMLGTGTFSLILDIEVLILFAAITSVIGIHFFRKMKI
jgi:ABC-2 type transport system permease protein